MALGNKCCHLPINTGVIYLVVLLPSVKIPEISELLILSSETSNGKKIPGTGLKFRAAVLVVI